MANERDIKIGIKTTADTSGAKAAEEAIKKVGQASDQAEGGGFGRDTAAARRIAELEAAEAAEAQADSLKKLAQATKDTAKELPALGEADIVAEGMERLGKSADAASGKTGGGGLGTFTRGLMAGGLALLGYQQMLTFGIEKFVAWRKAFEDWGASSDRRNQEMNDLAVSTAALAAEEKRAAESAEELAIAQKAIAAAAQESGANIGKYTERLREAADLESEMRRQREEIAGKKADLALEGAAGDPLRQAEIREAERVRRQEQQRQDIEADLERQRQTQREVGQALPALEADEGIAAEREASFAEIAKRQAEEANRMDRIAALAEDARKKSEEAMKEAEASLESFWTPTALKNQARETIPREVERQGALEQTETGARERARILREEEAMNRAAAEAEREKRENAQKMIEEQRAAFEQATREEERIKRTIPFVQEVQQLDTDRAGIEMENLRKREEEKREKERADDQERRLRDQEKRTGEEAGIGREALGLLPKDLPEKGRKAVERVARGLQDGDQGGEIKELIALMERLADAVDGKDTKTSIKIDGVLSRIKKLESK